MQQHPYTIPAVIIALGFIISTIIGGFTWTTVRGFDNALTVTGSAKKQVRADNVKWSLSIEQTVLGKDQVQKGYARLAEDYAAVRTMLLGAGVKEEEITSSAAFIGENGYYDPNRYPGAPTQYRVSQTITVQSSDVDKVTALAKNLGSLLNQGVFVNTISLEYYYTKLPDLRVELLGAALNDAKARAGEIAKAGGSNVGALRSASSGVVQVLGVNSGDVSDYGSYDTSNIEKEVSVTVRASFILR